MKIIYYSIIGYITTFMGYASLQVFADISITSPSDILPGNPTTNTDLPFTPTKDTAGNFIGYIISQFIGVIAVLTIIAITWAGIQMVLAVGEEEKMKKARYTMIYAFIGLVVSGLAYAAVNFVTNLKLDSFL